MTDYQNTQRRTAFEYGFMADLTGRVITSSCELFEERGEVDSALLAEEYGNAWDALFPQDYFHCPGFQSWLEGCIRDGIEQAMIPRYNEILVRLDLPAMDASELQACLAVGLSHGRGELPNNMKHVEDIQAAYDELGSFIDAWEAAGI